MSDLPSKAELVAHEVKAAAMRIESVYPGLNRESLQRNAEGMLQDARLVIAQAIELRERLERIRITFGKKLTAIENYMSYYYTDSAADLELPVNIDLSRNQARALRAAMEEK